MAAAHERRQLIVETLRRQGQVGVGDLADALKVAHETVRRDLNTLEVHGLVRRTHGGAFPVETPQFETRATDGSRHLADEQQQIARACLGELVGWESVFLDQGPTALMVAQCLARTAYPLTVVTPSLQVALALSEREDTDVIVLGGQLRSRALAVVGPSATAMLAELRPQIAVMTAVGVSLEHGASTSSPASAELKRMAMRSCHRAVLVGDHTTFGIGGFCRYAAIEDFALVLTGRRLSSHRASTYAARGVRVVRVGP